MRKQSPLIIRLGTSVSHPMFRSVSQSRGHGFPHGVMGPRLFIAANSRRNPRIRRDFGETVALALSQQVF
jgi:hypothetical protein